MSRLTLISLSAMIAVSTCTSCKLLIGKSVTSSLGDDCVAHAVHAMTERFGNLFASENVSSPWTNMSRRLFPESMLLSQVRINSMPLVWGRVAAIKPILP